MSDIPPPSSSASPLAALSSQARALWAKLPARARTAAIASMVGIVGLVGYLILAGGGPGWRKVTEGLTASDAIDLIGELDRKAIPHRLVNGKDVLVPAGKLDDARAVAVVAGIPRSKKGLSGIKSNPMATTRLETVAIQAALQDQLTSNLERLGPIERAEVSLAAGKDSVFDKGAPATASVMVHLRPGQSLTGAQVRGIKQMVANGVQGLTVDHVSVVDQDANPLSEEGDQGAEQQDAEEQKIVGKVLTLIEPVVGAGKVKVRAHIEYDRRTILKTEDRVSDPLPIGETKVWSGGPATPGAPASGLAGVQGNLPGTTGAPAAGGAPGTAAVTPPGTTTTTNVAGTLLSSTINSQVSRVTTQTEDPASRVAKVTVTVLLAEGVDENGDPAPFTPDQLTKLGKLAHGAAGLDDTRGDTLVVEAMPFAPIEVAAIPPVAGKKLPVPMPVAIGGGAVLLIAAVLFITRRKRKPAEDESVRIALPAPVSEIERALASPTTGDHPANPALPPGKSLEERVIGAVKGDVQRASRVLASWLAEPDPTPTTNAKGARA